MSIQPIEYNLVAPGLAQAVASTAPDAKHAGLTQVLRSTPELEGAKLVHVIGLDQGMRLKRRRVLDAQGRVVHENHSEWALEQCALDGNNLRATLARLPGLGFRLTEIGIERLYFAVDRGGDASDFEQIQVEHHVERVTHAITDSFWLPPETPRELANEIESSPLPESEVKHFGVSSYELNKHVYVGAFAVMAERVARDAREASARRIIQVKESRRGIAQPPKITTFGEMFPDLHKYPSAAIRMFQDWDSSSAGLSGQRLSDHWVIDTYDGKYLEAGGRTMSIVPRWTTRQSLRKISTRDGSLKLLRQLQALDKQVGVPFGWFFFMLHGNILSHDAGEMVLRAVDAGITSLPEADYLTLQRWQEQPYGY